MFAGNIVGDWHAGMANRAFTFKMSPLHISYKQSTYYGFVFALKQELRNDSSTKNDSDVHCTFLSDTGNIYLFIRLFIY